ncbi:MAG: protein translocase subunit SecD [Pelagibacteraceae bacterium]|jgi:preprotein translocase subunit SecD|nr:protein translocase subunit SecD [Pelagibacteraceae bacterium]HJL58050.1 protein translocase subunit SecD [Alphaproteobacteria bacterium]MBO6466052.1 protein translocase subunit SecD [Pelagibacteraceae bacterium]MBO6468305.1 protein translocase subunit SecD [Pelagibacteraceae bacterium]MBO6470171.1 protein translocase subunit SecD [Pelagibacteraceae bacterium]
MKNYPLWKSIVVILVICTGIIFAIPSIIYSENPSNWFLDNKVNLGLDLQGGSYLLLEVETDVLLKEELENISDTVRQISRNEKVNITNVIPEEDQIQFRFKNASSIENIRNQFINKYNYVKVVVNKNIMKIIINDDFKKRIQEAALKQSLEIVRKRIDESGTKEPLIQRSGKKRILLQLPGVKDPERIKELLGTTAKLTFHMVDEEDTVSLKANKAPFGKMIVQDYINPEIKYLVEKKSRVGGENLVDANASFDSNEGHAVSFRFDTTGAQKFGKATSDNVGKRFAVILDGAVITAPVIRSAITGGSGIISGNFTSQEAADLAVLLRAGALPAPLNIVEERSVGPGLGADSISSGKIASIIGMLCVCVFMILIYGVFGLLANISLIANLFIIVSLLGTIGATLTLPGIAGIVLTIGMAVDANVLVFERIKEELSKNSKAIVAIKNGFDKAISTILDANITTLIAALLLFVFGSGPIKGFSITLSLGVLASMFTAIMFTNFLIHLWLFISKKKVIIL